MSGAQMGSGSVNGFSSVSADWIAVIGRQNEYVYLALKDAIKPSALARLTSAINRAFSKSFKRRSAESESATCSQKSVVLELAQNCEYRVSSGVRVALSALPIVFVS